MARPHDPAVTRPAPMRTPASDAHKKARLERMVRDDYRLIWRFLRRLGVPEHAADDAAQQVFLIAAERLDDIRAHSERAFAYGTALRLSQSLRRKTAREPLSDELDQRASSEAQPDRLAELARARGRLDAVLEAMPSELRTVFVLFECEGFSSPEIAELCDVPLGTVASRLRRARERFHELVASAAWNRTGRAP